MVAAAGQVWREGSPGCPRSRLSTTIAEESEVVRHLERDSHRRWFHHHLRLLDWRFK